MEHSIRSFNEAAAQMSAEIGRVWELPIACPYQKPRRATTRSYSYCMPVTFRNNSKGKRPATKN
ncbi:MAG: hypothetical protein DMG41_00305 [Acidobacteria bacterium]|nr:MAG: hypothetical protein DMG41_00305 [Acidobacteriota bacterium]